MPIMDLDEAIRNSEKYFIEIGKIDQIIHGLDLNYIEGAILIKYYDQVLMDFQYWDLIDQLWAYFINLISEVILKGEAETYFPDQPTKMSLRSVSDSIVLFGLQDKRWTLPKNEFFNTLLNEANYFFETMHQHNMEGKFEFEIQRIQKIKKQLEN